MTRLYRATSNEEVKIANSNDTGVGKVVMETDKQNCELLKFPQLHWSYHGKFQKLSEYRYF